MLIAITPSKSDTINFDETIPLTKRFFLYHKRFFCSILKSKGEIPEIISVFEHFFQDKVRFSVCSVSSEKLRQLPVDYIFSILIHKLKLKRRKNESKIIVSNGYIAL